MAYRSGCWSLSRDQPAAHSHSQTDVMRTVPNLMEVEEKSGQLLLYVLLNPHVQWHVSFQLFSRFYLNSSQLTCRVILVWRVEFRDSALTQNSQGSSQAPFLNAWLQSSLRIFKIQNIKKRGCKSSQRHDFPDGQRIWHFFLCVNTSYSEDFAGFLLSMGLHSSVF